MFKRFFPLFACIGLSLAVTETSLYYAYFCNIDRVVEFVRKSTNQKDIYLYYKNILDYVTHVYHIKLIDIFIVFATIAVFAYMSTFFNPLSSRKKWADKQMSEIVVDIVGGFIVSFLFTSFIQRFMFNIPFKSFRDWVLPTFLGFVCAFLLRYLNINYLIVLSIWFLDVAVIFKYFSSSTNDVLRDLIFSGVIKDYILMSIIFVLITILYSQNYIDKYYSVSQLQRIFLLGAILFISVVAVTLDLLFPRSYLGRMTAESIAKVVGVTKKNFIASIIMIMNDHVLWRSVIFLFGGVVAPFSIFILYTLLKKPSIPSQAA